MNGYGSVLIFRFFLCKSNSLRLCIEKFQRFRAFCKLDLPFAVFAERNVIISVTLFVFGLILRFYGVIGRNGRRRILGFDFGFGRGFCNIGSDIFGFRNVIGFYFFLYGERAFFNGSELLIPVLFSLFGARRSCLARIFSAFLASFARSLAIFLPSLILLFSSFVIITRLR